MLLFVQFIQVARAMTTYENMHGVNHRTTAATLSSAFTSTGTPLDPAVAAAASGEPNAGGHGHHHRHRHGGMLGHWARLLGVDIFFKTARGRTAATAGGVTTIGKRRKDGNPYSNGCWSNCKDFWCDPAPLFGRRETGAAVLGGQPVNYTEMYESPVVSEILRTGGRRRGGYEAVAGEEV
jgi:hypothetical protein